MYYIDDYEKSLKEKGVSDSTVSAYLSDIDDFEEFFGSRNLEKAKAENIQAYLEHLSGLGKSAATTNRRISSLRSFYEYLRGLGVIKSNPCSDFKAEKTKEKDIEYLSEAEMTTLLGLPANDAAGLRDRALLELMYATGLKVSEVCSLNVSDLNMVIGYVSVSSGDKARVVPIGKYCRSALKEYMLSSRQHLLGKKGDDGALFLSYLGERITRQGIWKILKSYNGKADFSSALSPQLIRNSFAVHLVQHGADLKSLQELLGHEDIMATKIFLKFSKNRIMDVYNRAFPRA